MSKRQAETTDALHARIDEAIATVETGASRLARQQASGYRRGLQSCITIALERDARDAELSALRDAVEPRRGESLTNAVKRWVRDAKFAARRQSREAS
tara:strand:+ start:432 stop:725 length:294 start_codon:yes stop_codon:yes gene_type:complete